MVKVNKRAAPRRKVEPIQVSQVMSLDHFVNIAKSGYIVEASITGFLLHIDRKDILPSPLRENLSLQGIEGDRVMIFLPLMNIEIAGRITRTKLSGKRGFEIAIDYTDDAPEYWRECLLDLLPSPGELD